MSMGISPQDTEADRVYDERLVEAASHGDDEAFSRLVSRHKHRVFGLASRFARHSHELDDICQDVFIKVYEHLGKFRREAPFEHWLSRITINVCYDAIKKAKREKDHLPIEALSSDIRDGSPEAGEADRQAYETLMCALARLRPDERVVITLLELEEKSVKDVAALMGWSEGNIRVRAHRARQALKKILEEHHESS
jgi:RNA polymerase sigma-70 factor, ECF subfamily